MKTQLTTNPAGGNLRWTAWWRANGGGWSVSTGHRISCLTVHFYFTFFFDFCDFGFLESFPFANENSFCQNSSITNSRKNVRKYFGNFFYFFFCSKMGAVKSFPHRTFRGGKFLCKFKNESCFVVGKSDQLWSHEVGLCVTYYKLILRLRI